ncbi:monofunctional biosynthetic peptidoglycan transglycosylase [Pseudomarimonas arenosa]|uniref:Biosynthetic peptidoglycan transglycosylase n=1 Tax=Pseudomarimonas arenosa TaxID=2774145 RepID=A0AAW3ZFX1_9GAMM|nr:monofunctional biosynthetic peptidoglycan transglycosylase [Pseudomarimonas arenosa]MBD8524983.1 monofunctional biosynthetic peptidoglycan transglycosylase [Pseudomarimonas arenosa]
MPRSPLVSRHRRNRSSAADARKPRRRWRRWLLRLLLALILLLLLSWLPVLAMRWWDPPTTAFIQQAAADGQTIEQHWRPISRISPELQLAVIAAEDQHFPQHNGFDLDAIEAALRESGASGRGASTISQQVAKNLFLWSGRSLVRKGLEAWMTGLIEITWPKARILEVYLNIAEFGPGIYGAEAAAQLYFKRSAAQLSRPQAAALAAVLPSPRRYSVTQPSAYVRSRSAWIQRQMSQLGGQAFLRQMETDGRE